MKPVRVLSILLLLVTVAQAPASADSLPSFFGIGVYFRDLGYPTSDGQDSSPGLGGEMSLQFYPRSLNKIGVGVFTQIEAASLNDEALNHLRLTVGGQIAGVLVFGHGGVGLGSELGLCLETTDALFAGAVELHVAPFVSIDGVLALSFPIDVRLGSFGAGMDRGLGVGIALALKIPIPAGKLF